MESTVNLMEGTQVKSNSPSLRDIECDIVFRQLSDISIRNLAFEDEILSHLSAIQELNSREQQTREFQNHIITDRLVKIEEKIEGITNGGLKSTLQELLPVLVQSLGVLQIENTKGIWSSRTAAISGAFAALGGVVTWLITKFL